MPGRGANARAAMLRSAVAFLPLLLAACGDIDVRSIRSGDVVPEELEGEWWGAWISALSGVNGVLTLRIQHFAGEPVVGVQIAHPCLPPNQYEFRATASTVELLADDVVLFRGVLGDDRTLIGTYGCAADLGSWDATWHRDLPPVADLGGLWVGTVTVPGLPTQEMQLQLEQSVRDGALVLTGAGALPGLLTEPLPLLGQVQFRQDAFDLGLVTAPGILPIVQLVGIGDTASLQITNGQLQVAVDPLHPIVQGLWSVQRVGP